MKTRITAMLLAIVMVLTILPMPVLATEKTDSTVGMRIVMGSYKTETIRVSSTENYQGEVLTIKVQALLPDKSGVSPVYTILTYDNSKLQLLNKAGLKIDVSGESATKNYSGSLITSHLSAYDYTTFEPKNYTVGDNYLFTSGNKTSMSVGMYYTYVSDNPDIVPNPELNEGTWFDVYSVKFEVKDSPSSVDEVANILNVDSIRFADPQYDATLIAGLVPEKNAYCVKFGSVNFDNIDASKNFCFYPMSESVSLSTYQYMMVAENVTATYPGSTNKLELAAPSTATWNGTTATWSAVEGAESYEVKLYNGSTLVTTKTLEATAMDLEVDFSTYTTATGEYTFTVQAKTSDTRYGTGVIATSGTHKHTASLKAPTSLTWGTDNIAKWEDDNYVDGVKYSIQLYKYSTSGYAQIGGAIVSETKEINLTDELNKHGTGKYKFTVTAVSPNTDNYGNSDPSEQSVEHAYVAPLPKVTGLAWNGNWATWTRLVGEYANCVSGYEVALYDEKDTAIGDPTTVGPGENENFVNFGEQMSEKGNGKYYFTVIAKSGEKNTFTDGDEIAKSELKDYKKPAVALDNVNNVQWENVDTENPNASWSLLEGAVGYRIQYYKDNIAFGNVHTVEKGINTHELDFNNITEPGEFTFTVQAIGDGTIYKDSENPTTSDEYNHKVQLETPTNLKWNIVNEPTYSATAVWECDDNNATKFEVHLYVKKDDITTEVNLQNNTVTEKSYAFTTIIQETGNYTFTVQALSSNTEKYKNSDIANSNDTAESFGNYQYTKPAVKLDAPTNPKWDVTITNKATWDRINNATSYVVQLYIDNVPKDEYQTENNTNYLEIDFSNIDVPGEYSFKVTAIGNTPEYSNSDPSFRSDTYSHTVPLKAPTGLAWAEDGTATATWTANDAANTDYYVVKLLNGDEVLEVNENVIKDATSYPFKFKDSDGTDIASGKYTFSVQAMPGTGSMYTESTVEKSESEYVHLTAVTNPVWKDDNATWDSIGIADKYIVTLYRMVNNTESIIDVYSTETASYDFSHIFPDAGYYKFKVKAVVGTKEGPVSAFSDQKLHTVTLDAPANATWADSATATAQWDSVSHATGYRVELWRKTSEQNYVYTDLFSEVKATTNVPTTCTFTIPSAGEYFFRVYTLGDTYYLNSTTYTDSTTEIFQESLPKVTDTKWNGTTAEWNSIDTTAEFEYSVQLYKFNIATNKYEVYKEPVSDTDKDCKVTFTFSDPGYYTFTVTANPKNDKLYIPSVSEWGDEEPYKHTKTLSNPTGLKWKENTATATWDKVENASAYKLCLFKDNIRIENYYDVDASTLEFDFSNIINTKGSYQFEVQALGSDETCYENSTTVVSNTPHYIYKEPLPAPTGLAWEGEVAVAKWDAVAVTDATIAGYNVQLLRNDVEYGNVIFVDSGTKYDFKTAITKNGNYTFTVQAVANEDTVYSNSSVVTCTAKFEYLVEVGEATNLAWVDNSRTATWTAATNANKYRVQLYKNGEAFGEPITVSTTSCDFSELIKETANYTFTVQAINDDGGLSEGAKPTPPTDPTVNPGLEYEQKQLTAPTNLKFENGMASWDEVDGATSYIVRLFSEGNTTAIAEHEVVGNSYNFNGTLEENKSYTFEVVAVDSTGEYSNSETSDASSTYTVPADDGFSSWFPNIFLLFNQTFNVSAIAGEGGSISPAGDSAVRYNNSITYTITPDKGYEISAVFVDGIEVEVTDEYTFRSVQTPHSIYVEFALLPAEEAWENTYDDVSENDDSFKAIAYVSANGLFKGVTETTFAPNTAMTRGMFVTVLGRLAGVDVNDYSSMRFSTINPSEWYAPYVEWAASTGLVNGYDADTFGEQDKITVEQAIVILARYAERIGIDTDSNAKLIRYLDANEVSDWATDAMKWAVETGIYEGTYGRLNPKSNASRAFVAEMLYAFVTKYFD